MFRLGVSALKSSPCPLILRPTFVLFGQFPLPRRRNSTKPQSALNTEALNVEHSQFLSQAGPGFKWKQGMGSMNSEDVESPEELEGIKEGRGKLLPTSTHLFKLVLPLGDLSHRHNVLTKPSKFDLQGDVKSNVPPTVILLHPAQPLSHASRLIQASMAPALPTVSFRSMSTGGQAFQWSDSTDIGDFIRDAARSAQFFICLTYEPSKHLRNVTLNQDSDKLVATNNEGGTKDEKQGDPNPMETIIEVDVPTFADRTRYIRQKVKYIERQIASMEGVKQHCEREARRGARRMAVTGFGVLVVYVARLTFWDYGWDVMEPVTYLSGLSMVVLGYLWFLYKGREVSYSSVLSQSISSRRDALYKSEGFDIDRWGDLIVEQRSLRKEIRRIAEDYDYEEGQAQKFKDDIQEDLSVQDENIAGIGLAESKTAVER